MGMLLKVLKRSKENIIETTEILDYCKTTNLKINSNLIVFISSRKTAS